MLTAGLELKCEYKDDSCTVHPEGLLSKRTIGESFTISGSQNEKKDTCHAAFSRMGKVAHLPTEIYKEFPKLVKLSIEWSEIPLLKKNMFKPAFKKIRELSLSNNGIQLIEQEAFKHLTNLIVLKLDHNQIKTLDQKLFLHNLKLEEIDLSHNSLSRIDPQTFDKLTQLKAVNFMSSDLTCVQYVSETFSYMDLNSRRRGPLTRRLRMCHDDYREKWGWMTEGEFS